MSSVIVAKASVILAFKFVISGTDVENTLSLTYPHKKKSRVRIRRSWWPGSRTISPNPPVWKYCIQKTDENANPSAEVHHLVGKLSTAETLLTEVQRKVPTCPGKHLFVIRDFMFTLYVHRNLNKHSNECIVKFLYD